MSSEQGIEEGTIRDAIPAFPWQNRRKPRKISVRSAGVPIEIRTGHFESARPKHY
jgi:hypothetical protein